MAYDDYTDSPNEQDDEATRRRMFDTRLRALAKPNISPIMTAQDSADAGNGGPRLGSVLGNRGTYRENGNPKGEMFDTEDSSGLMAPNTHRGDKPLGMGSTATNRLSTGPEDPVYSSTRSAPARPTLPGSGETPQPSSGSRFAASRPNIPASRFSDTDTDAPSFTPPAYNGKQVLGLGYTPVLGRGPQPARPDVMPQRSDFEAKPELGGWKKVLGLGAGFALGSPQLVEATLHGQADKAERNYQGALRDWQRGQEGQERQARIEETQARTRSLLNPPQKEGVTPEETTLDDLMTGNNGQPQINPDTGRPYTRLEAYSKVQQAKTGAATAAKQPPLGATDIEQINQMHTQRFQTLNPGKPLPAAFTLRPGATQQDYDRVDKNLSEMESSAGTQAQRESTNAFRSQQAADAAERRDQARQDREDKESALQVFAVDPRTRQRSLMSVGEARAQGIRSYQKVSQPDIEKETSLNSQMNDMQLNTSRYRAALNAMGQLSPQDGSAMTRILSDKAISGYLTNELTLGALMDQISQGEKGRAWNRLSPDKQEALIGYLRMKNTGLLAQKVLTGMGRASKEAWQVEIDNMPSPIEGATVGNKKLDAWQDNLDQINSRSVKLPWMEQPTDVRARVEGQATQQYNQRQGQNKPAPQNPGPAKGGIRQGLVNFLNRKMGAQ